MFKELLKQHLGKFSCQYIFVDFLLLNSEIAAVENLTADYFTLTCTSFRNKFRKSSKSWACILFAGKALFLSVLSKEK